MVRKIFYWCGAFYAYYFKIASAAAIYSPIMIVYGHGANTRIEAGRRRPMLLNEV
jgi:hypothetical protein